MNKFFLILGILIFALFVAWLVRNYLPQRNSQGTDAGETPLVADSLESDEKNFSIPKDDVQVSDQGKVEGTDFDQESEMVSEPPGTKRLPFRVQLVYSPGYLINLGGLERLHPFDIKKYKRIHDQLVADGLVSNEQTLRPSSLTEEELMLIHTEQYLEDLKVRRNVARYLEAGVLEYAPVSLEKGIKQPFRLASGGTLLAARKALETGIGINIGGGYHHAKPETGEGFCIYADVPIAIRKLQQEGLIKTALVVDVDVHQGNGTSVCLNGDDSTFCFSMHQGDIYPIPKEPGDRDVELDSGMRDDEYLQILKANLPELFDQSKPDICFIVGGCDTLAGDPLASLAMTPAGIVSRDAMIVQNCVDRNVPVVMTLAGGYSADAWQSQYQSIRNLIEKYSLAPDESTPAEEESTEE